MTAALDQQCGLAARFDRMEVGERRVAARERHEVTLGETRRLVEDRRGRFMMRTPVGAVDHTIEELCKGGGSVHVQPSAMLYFGRAAFEERAEPRLRGGIALRDARHQRLEEIACRR